MPVKVYAIVEDLKTGWTEIDDQHIELFDRLNKLLIAVESGRPIKEVRDFIRFLADYIKEHLELEERYMRDNSDYPLMAEHLEQHEKFRSNFKAIIESFNAGTLSLDVMIGRLEQNIGDWFEGHIKDIDTSFAAFMLGKLGKG